MPSFDTPEPISASARVGAGSIRFIAGDRLDTVRNALTASETPQESQDTVKVRARTRHGNIDVRRARA